MKVINNNTVVIYSSSELKTVLENDNGYDYIYFGNDITLEKGIKISSSKVNVTIDGTYEGVRYTFTDYEGLSSGDTISVSSPLTLKVTVCNMEIVGYNYYGIIYVLDNSSYKNTIIEYNNILYEGPQISFHPAGLTRFIDSDITIVDGALVTGNEVAECNKIEIGGITNIVHNSKNNSAFWFRNSNPSFTILTNALVNFTSENRELFYGVNNLLFSVLNNAYFSVTSHNGMAYGSYATGTTNIAANAEFILKQTGTNGSNPAWRSYGVITMSLNSSLTIINDYSGILASNYNILFSSSGGLILNNPKKVVLYNEKANVINSTSSIPFEFNVSRINLFNNIINIKDDITLSTMPEYSWYKELGSISISGNFTSSVTNITSNNFTSDELKELPALSNLVFANKKIFSIGTFPFRVNALTNTDTTITGSTISGSSILISYNDINDVVLVDSDGNFSYSYINPLDIGTIITFNVKMKDDVIYNTKVIQIVYSGELVIDSASETIGFTLIPISNNPILCKRNSQMIVTIIDSRVNSTDFKLYASIDHKLISSDNDIFDGAIVYKDSSGNVTELSNTKVLVYKGESNNGTIKTTNVTWNDDEGILLMINNKIIAGKEYTTHIIWSVEE